MTVVEVKTLNHLGVGLGAPVHPHHAWMEKGITCRSGSRPKKTSCGARHPVFALVAERFYTDPAQHIKTTAVAVGSVDRRSI